MASDNSNNSASTHCHLFFRRLASEHALVCLRVCTHSTLSTPSPSHVLSPCNRSQEGRHAGHCFQDPGPCSPGKAAAGTQDGEHPDELAFNETCAAAKACSTSQGQSAMQRVWQVDAVDARAHLSCFPKTRMAFCDRR